LPFPFYGIEGLSSKSGSLTYGFIFFGSQEDMNYWLAMVRGYRKKFHKVEEETVQICTAPFRLNRLFFLPWFITGDSIDA
jgi:hypothetical protein